MAEAEFEMTVGPPPNMDKYRRAVQRALVRAVTTIAETVVNQAKQRVHRGPTGTLSRSLHTALIGYGGENDLGAAAQQELFRPGSVTAAWQGNSAVLLAGSWIPYARCEALRGGSHDYWNPAVEEARRRSVAIIRQALKEELPK